MDHFQTVRHLNCTVKRCKGGQKGGSSEPPRTPPAYGPGVAFTMTLVVKILHTSSIHNLVTLQGVYFLPPVTCQVSRVLCFTLICTRWLHKHAHVVCGRGSKMHACPQHPRREHLSVSRSTLSDASRFALGPHPPPHLPSPMNDVKV